MLRGILISLIVLCAGYVQGQDIHFSQFNRSYLNLNPALAGSFNGDFRLNGNFRNQWSSISEPFQTISFAADAKSPINAIPRLHLGLIISNDRAGVGDLQSSQFLLNLAYIQKLNSDSSLSLKFGVQSGLNSRSINYDAFRFDEQFQSGAYNPQLGTGEDFGNNSINRLALNSGVALEFFQDPRHKAEIGIAFFNMNQADLSFEGEAEAIDMRTTLFIKAEHEISEKVDLIPSLLYSNQGDYNESVFGANIRYYMSENNFYRRRLYAGLWLRPGDAIIPSLGFDYNQWHFGASYDINISSLDIATNQKGGLELSVTYIISSYKAVFRNYQRCPKFL